ncbi:FAST kinase domain-containing protein 5, mitochondrial-like [Battus philenor]|uniref:FAST kinase domain-containing protein 5, mitochondrial-like n=1 Tax=Battus philenor TaxID=42288 RepID=UPI0035D0CD29
MTVYKILQTISNTKFLNRVYIRVVPTNTKFINHLKGFHSSSKLCVKMYVENENKYAYSIMENNGYVKKLDIGKEKNILPKHSLQYLLSENWSLKTPKEIFETFSILGTLCSEQKLCISDKMFDDFIDILTDNLTNGSDSELQSIFYSLLNWPEVKSITTRNYIEVWVALDEECLRRIKGWSFDEMLNFLSLYYMLNIIRASDFSFKCLLKLSAKAKHLTPSQLVRTMFFIGVRRNSPEDIHNLEVQINNCFNQFTIDELAIISMGFFKSKTPIRNIAMVENIINKIHENSTTIHEISLAALLKVVRYSMKYTKDDKVYILLDRLLNEVPRLSVLCNVHIALLASSTLTFHEGCLNAIANKVNASLSQSRIKDLERLALTFATFNYKPPCKDIFLNMVNELKKPERENECSLHGRAFACCIAYLTLLDIYDKDLIKIVFNPVFLEKTYGKYCVAYGREILTLNNRVKIFCKDNNINLLTEKQTVLMTKKYTDYVPNENYKKQYNFSEKILLDVLNILKESRGNEYVAAGHILSHHQRGDIILCNDEKGSAIPVQSVFNKRCFGLLWTPPDDYKWIVLIIGGRNALIHNTNLPSGPFSSKINELKALGFYPGLVTWEDLSKCETKEAKLKYINNLIYQTITKN